MTGRILNHEWFPEPIPENVILGDASWCYSSFAFLHNRSRRPQAVTVGHDSGIYHGTFFDLGEEGEVAIGNYCAIVGVIFSTNARVVIGDYSFIAHDVVIADSYAAVPFATGSTARSSGSIWVGENCWIGARAILLAGCKLGDNAIVGAAAVVNFAVPAGSVVAGNPARIVG